MPHISIKSPVTIILLIGACGLGRGADTKAGRPPIVGVANIEVKTSNPESARNFYEHALGLQQAFTVKRNGSLGIACFKVSDGSNPVLLPDA